MKGKRKKSKGFTLIELIVVIAILGILVILIVPNVGRYIGDANERVNQANAKLLSNVAQMIFAEKGYYPGPGHENEGVPNWDSSFPDMTPEKADGLITDKVQFLPVGSGNFTYVNSTGKVTVPEGSGTPVPTPTPTVSPTPTPTPAAPSFALGTGSHSNDLYASNCTGGATLRLYWYLGSTGGTPTEVIITGIPYTLGSTEYSHYFTGTLTGYYYCVTQTVAGVQSAESVRVHR